MAATTDVPITKVTRAGVSVATAAATPADGNNGNSFNNSGVEYAIIEVAGAANDVVATFVTPITVDGLAVSDRTVAVGANSRVAVGPFPVGIYNGAPGSADPNKVTVTWAGTLTDATIMVIGI